MYINMLITEIATPNKSEIHITTAVYLFHFNTRISIDTAASSLSVAMYSHEPL